MAITINGSGTVTGITAGGLPDGVITTDDLAANAVTTAKLGTDEASGLCKAWVNFNGTGTVAIRDSYNVSSITDNGTGNYTVNFTTALPDANYCPTIAGSQYDASGGTYSVGIQTSGSSGGSAVLMNPSQLRVLSQFSDTGQNQDFSYICVAIFR